MGRRSAAAVGIGALATVAATAVLGGVTGAPGGLGEALSPPAGAAELEAFEDCGQLRRWYVDAALPHVGPWGLGGWPWGPVPLTASARASGTVELDAAVPQEAVGSAATGTNVQEPGVDEPDVAKTDGRLLVHVDGRRLVATDVTGAAPRELSTLPLPGGLGATELLLVGDRVVVLGTTGSRGPSDAARGLLSWPGDASTRVLVVDASDPAAPVTASDTTYDASLVSARQYDDVVRLVLSTREPALDFVQPRRGLSRAEAKRENRRIVRESTIDAWLPQVQSTSGSGRLVDCSAVRHPERSSGYGTVTVVGLDPADPQTRRTTAVTTGSDLVYSSSDRLYLATRERRRTGVHAFALEGLDAAYVASGSVRGRVRDRWSLSEYDGHLRVATALGQDPWAPEENGVVVLRERGSDLVEVGRVDAMGIDERIQSVRWFDDLAVVVTFREVDPLYTVDLSDPTAPQVLGQLKVPGFSAYLHPLGDGLLLGLGQDARPDGRTLGAQAAVFDLRDLTDPRRLDTLGFGRSTELVAGWDPRGLTYLPDTRTALAVLADWRGGGTRLAVLRVGDDGALTERSRETVAGWDGHRVRTLPLPDGRVALVTPRGVDLFTP